MRQRIALGPLVSCCHTCPAKLIPISLQSRQCCCRRSASNQLSSEWPVSPFNRQRTHTPTTRSRPYRTVYRKDKSVSASIQAINYLNGAEPVTKHRNAIKDLSLCFQRLSRSPFSPGSGRRWPIGRLRGLFAGSDSNKCLTALPTPVTPGQEIAPTSWQGR